MIIVILTVIIVIEYYNSDDFLTGASVSAGVFLMEEDPDRLWGHTQAPECILPNINVPAVCS